MDGWEYIKLAAWSASGVAALFATTHAVVKPDVNKFVAAQLRELRLSDLVTRWPTAFTSAFDGLFGTHFLSLKFIIRSVIASLVALVFVFGVFFNLANVTVGEYIATWGGIWGTLVGLGLYLLANLPADYFSLVETRLLLRLVARRPSAGLIAVVLLCDIILTGLVFYLVAPAFLHLNLVNSGVRELEQIGLTYVIAARDFMTYVTNPQSDVTTGVYFEGEATFYTTFFTSLWLWLFGAAMISLRLVAQVGDPLWKRLRDRVLNIEEKPILSLGWLSGGLVIFGFALGTPFVFS